MSADQATHVSDVLLTTQNLGKTSVDELSASMGKVIPLAAAYGVSVENLSSGLAVMTANGIATAEATTYTKSMLNELGDSGSTVGKILQKQTGKSFAQLNAEGKSLGDVLQILYNSVGGNSTAFAGLWSSVEPVPSRWHPAVRTSSTAFWPRCRTAQAQPKPPTRP